MKGLRTEDGAEELWRKVITENRQDGLSWAAVARVANGNVKLLAASTMTVFKIAKRLGIADTKPVGNCRQCKHHCPKA